MSSNNFLGFPAGTVISGGSTGGDISAHTEDLTIHFTQADIDHNAIQNNGNYNHLQLDAHVDDATIHYAQTSIDHNNLVNKGTLSHATIDSYLDQPVQTTSDPTFNSVQASLLSAPEVTTNIISSIGGVSFATPTVTLGGGTSIAYDGKPNQGIVSGIPGQYIIQAEQKMVLRADNGDLELDSEGGGNVILSSDSGDVNVQAIGSSGTINLTSDADLTLESNFGSVNINAPEADVTLSTVDGDIYLRNQTGSVIVDSRLTINTQGNNYAFPAVRGTLGQVMTSDAIGVVTWQDPVVYNQTLNTTDSVRFGQVNIGTIGGGFTLPSNRGTLGQYLRQNAAGIVSWTDLPSSAHGVMSMVGNTLPTSFSAAGNYTQIVGTRTGSQLKDFVFAPNVLQYTGDSSEFLINVSQTWIHSLGTPDEFRLAVFKNGVIVATSEQRCNLDSDADYPRSSSTNAIVSLSNGDQIDVRIANFDDTTTVTVIDHTFSIVKVGLVTGGTGSNTFNQDLNTIDSPTFAGLSVPTLTAPVDDIDVVARELTIQNPVAGSTLLEIRSNGSGDSVLAFNEGVAGVWEIYKTIANDLAINNTNSGDDLIVFSNTSNSINIIKDLFIGDTQRYKMPATRGTVGQVLYEVDGNGSLGWKDIVHPMPFRLIHAQDDPNTVQNAFSELSILVFSTPGIGSRTLPANSPIGTTVQYQAQGTFNYGSGTVRIRFKAGGTTMSNTLISPPGAILSYGWTLSAMANIQTGNNYFLTGVFSYVINPATGETKTEVITSFSNPNLTVDNLLDITIQFSAATPTNRLTTLNSSIELKIPDSAIGGVTLQQQIQEIRDTLSILTA